MFSLLIAIFAYIGLIVSDPATSSFYAISVLVGFLLSLTAAVKFAFYTQTYYLTLAIPGLLMVAFALVVNMGRYEGWVIVGLGIVMAYYLRKKWIAGGRQAYQLQPLSILAYCLPPWQL